MDPERRAQAPLAPRVAEAATSGRDPVAAVSGRDRSASMLIDRAQQHFVSIRNVPLSLFRQMRVRNTAQVRARIC
jgi:hypothetical protein